MGSPVIFIHGFGGFADIWYWQRKYLLGRRKVVAVDLPGHGQRPWNDENLAVMASLVRSECLSAGVESGSIVASSFGGLVTVKLCEMYPDMVQRIMFVGALPKFTATDDFPAGLNTEHIRKLAGQFEDQVASVLDMFFRSVFTIKERKSEQYIKIKELRRLATVPSREALLGILDLLDKEDLRTQLTNLNKPSLFVFGDGDPLCPLAVVPPLLKLCPYAKVEVFKGAGHFPFLSMPEVFNRCLERFIQC